MSRTAATAFRVLLITAVSFAAAAWPAGRLGPGEDIRREASTPNIIIILSDDQGWGDLSINGNTNLKTPNIDALARRADVRSLLCVPGLLADAGGTAHGTLSSARRRARRLHRPRTDEPRRDDHRQLLRAPAIGPARSANGTTAANGLTIPTPAASRSTMASPPDTGASISIRRWNTTASLCAARASLPTISPTRPWPSSRKNATGRSSAICLQHAAFAVLRARRILEPLQGPPDHSSAVARAKRKIGRVRHVASFR